MSPNTSTLLLRISDARKVKAFDDMARLLFPDVDPDGWWEADEPGQVASMFGRALKDAAAEGGAL